MPTWSCSMPTWSSMDEECWGPKSLTKEVYSTSVTSSCFLCCGGGLRDPNRQCQYKCAHACMYVCAYVRMHVCVCVQEQRGTGCSHMQCSQSFRGESLNSYTSNILFSVSEIFWRFKQTQMPFRERERSQYTSSVM